MSSRFLRSSELYDSIIASREDVPPGPRRSERLVSALEIEL
jgi:hypothetical protein